MWEDFIKHRKHGQKSCMKVGKVDVIFVLLN